jgi:ribosomal protein L30/L7E
MLKCIQPYVTYGHPSLETVKELIYKRGFGKVNKQRIPLPDNAVISASLSQYGNHSMKDLTHEIYTVGPYLKQAANFLWPFKLSAPKGGVKCKRHGFCEQRATGAMVLVAVLPDAAPKTNSTIPIMQRVTIDHRGFPPQHGGPVCASDNAVISANQSHYGIHGMEEKQKATAQREKKRAEERHDLKMRTRKCDKEYAAHQRKLILLSCQAKTAGNFFTEPEAKLLFLTRTVGFIKLDPKPHKVLASLRLQQLYDGFLKVSKPILSMLTCIQPYVT